MSSLPIPAPSHTGALQALVTRVCQRIPPLWDLSNYVAVNPFLGFAAQPLADAARTISDGLGAQVLPDLAFYRARWQAGGFSRADLARAARRAGSDPLMLEALLDDESRVPLRPSGAVLTFAERHDQAYGSAWDELILRHVALWCAVFVPEGLARWGREHLPGGLYANWRAAAQVDRSLEIEGLAGWRAWVAALPATPGAAIATLLDQIDISAAEREAYLYRLLGGVYGWASFLRRAAWEAGDDSPGDLAELLAIRLCADAAVAQLAPHGARPPTHSAPAASVEDEAVRAVLQDALEDGYAHRLLATLAPPTLRAATRPAVQAIFCIDVRSEPLRRHLEAQSPQIETHGFAGFFGVSLDWQTGGEHSARCPVLLKPAVQVQSLAPVTAGLAQSALKHMQTAPAASFSFVEIVGLSYGIALAADALVQRGAARPAEGSAPFTLDADGGNGGAPAAHIDLAAGILKNMGLRAPFARLVLLCGHASRSENNPHAAGLDCGACGGHSGGINARVAAALLNDSAVRAGLAAHGWDLPGDTCFIPALHDTAVDNVTLLDSAQVPASHRADLAQLERWLAQAGAHTRAERAPALGLGSQPARVLDRLLHRRARDWSEVRPEWALARNAAFIAARRARTRGVDLGGRAFLHEYDWTTDADGSVLALILSAPMVVASWINLQYFGSTVDNRVFGCGTKALHNRVGALGVVLGNGGDLRTGLALQSVHAADGSWYHEPLRLQVIVEAPRDRITATLAAHPGVRELVENGWVRLFALDPASNDAARYVPAIGWEAVEA